MSPKELLYIEDALGHEKQMKDACTDYVSMLSDAELKNFVQDLCVKYKSGYEKFYGLLGN